MSILQNTRKFIRVAGLGSAVVAMSSAGIAFAGLDVTTDTSNDTTGANSVNTNDTDVRNTVRERFSNRADIDNWASLFIRSGFDDIRQNTTVEDIMGGGASVSASFTNEANTSDMDGLGGDMDVMVDHSGSNDTTGFSSVNTNTLNVRNRHTVTVRNDADIDNDIRAHISTGFDDIEQNTTVSGVSGGDASFDLTVENVANSGASSMMGMGGGSVSVSSTGGNSTTGANSVNTNDVTVNNTTRIDVTNRADIDNDIHLSVDTSAGDIEQNTTVDGVSTGDADISLTISNVAN